MIFISHLHVGPRVSLHEHDGAVCIAGDVVPLGINREVVGPMTPDEEPARAFLRLARDAGWEILPPHDPALRDHRWYRPPRRRPSARQASASTGVARRPGDKVPSGGVDCRRHD